MIRFSHVYQPYGSYTAFGIPLSSIKYPVRFRLASECDPTGYRMQGNQRPDASPKTSIKKMRGAGRQFSGTSPHTAHNAIITCIHYNKNASSTPTNTYGNARPVDNGPHMMCMECHHALIIKYQWPIDLHKYTYPLSIYYKFCCRKVNIFHRLIVCLSS